MLRAARSGLSSLQFQMASSRRMRAHAFETQFEPEVPFRLASANASVEVGSGRSRGTYHPQIFCSYYYEDWPLHRLLEKCSLFWAQKNARPLTLRIILLNSLLKH
jgi:hypothetical protein